MVDSAAWPASAACCALSDSRSASRRVSSPSTLVISAIVLACASSARIRSTLACWVLIRDSRSTSCAVTSWAAICRCCSVPSRLIASSVLVNLSAATRTTIVAVDRRASLVRSSPAR